MEISFKILKRDLQYLEVNGNEYSKEYYSSNFTSNKGEFMYTDTVTLNLLYKVDSEENEVLVDAAICEHLMENNSPKKDYTLLQFKDDGLYKIIHMIIPTLNWYLRYTRTYDTYPYTYTYVYDDGEIYKVTNELIIKVDVEVFSELNFNSDYPIYLDDVYTFTMSNLKKCLYETIKPLLHLFCNGCSKGVNVFLRDLIWMAINSIQYCLDVGNFFEAQRLLESISDCSTGCTQYNNNLTNTSCNCHENI